MSHFTITILFLEEHGATPTGPLWLSFAPSVNSCTFCAVFKCQPEFYLPNYSWATRPAVVEGFKIILDHLGILIVHHNLPDSGSFTLLAHVYMIKLN